MQITKENIDGAFDRIETIAHIHEDKDDKGRLEALQAYQEFLGMTEDSEESLVKRAKRFVPEDIEDYTSAVAWVYIGVIIGLSAAAEALNSD